MKRWSLLGVAFTALVVGGAPHAAAATAFNGRIAFDTEAGLASMNPDGSGQWPVARGYEYGFPSWSPDGSRIAVSVHGGGNREGIVVMQPDGSDQQLIVTDENAQSPVWAPDGRSIAYQSGWDLVVVAADGTNGRIVYTSPTGQPLTPTWSPDGTRIAFATGSPVTGLLHLAIVDLGSGAVTALPPVDAYEPSWSPDGRAIAFNTGDSVETIAPDGSNLQFVAQNAADPAWSPDGTRIAFIRNYQELWTARANGSDQQKLATAPGIRGPAWQPLPPPPTGCTVWGTSGNDILIGTNGNDIICGLSGDDHLMGLGGDDVLEGDAGNDHLAGGLGYDILNGGLGNDVLDARDGGRDVLDGGPGVDTATVDGRIDATFSMEHVRVDKDLAAWHPATASVALPTGPASAAFDGDPATAWSGDFNGPGWVEVDLLQREQIGSVRLVTASSADSATLLLGSATAAGPFRLLHTFRGPTADDEQITFAPRQPWRNLRYLRLAVTVPAYSTGTPLVPELAAYAPRAAR